MEHLGMRVIEAIKLCAEGAEELQISSTTCLKYERCWLNRTAMSSLLITMRPWGLSWKSEVIF